MNENEYFISTNTVANSSITYTDNATWIDGSAWEIRPTGTIPIGNKKKEGVEMKTLYDVYMVYAENRKKPVMEIKRGIIASDEEDAKIKSGLMKSVQEDWDADFLTFVVNKIGDVKVKEKPKEVKQV